MTSLLLLFLSAAPCAPEKCEAECVAGAAKSCVAAAAALQASNPIKAAAFLQRACSAEDGPACAELAALFRGGRGVPADATQARQFEGRACALKVGTSCLELGRAEEKQAALARTAEDTRGGMARSAAYLSAGCDAKVPAACGELARLHAWGCGVKADVTAAARLAKQACDAGDKPACRYLAFFLEEGLGGRRDARRAAELLKANADAKPLAPPPACDDSPGLISFESGARGVEVQVDGLALGAAPVVARLSAGAHVVVARAPAREPVRLELTVTAGQRGRQVLEWPASLRVETTPPGALVTLDGKEAGLTPVTAPLPTGRHEVTVALAGFAREARTVSLAAGEERVERLELRSLPGLAQVSSEPPGAQLEVDGKPVGTTPWSGVLPPGPHRARATLERFLPLDQPFTVSRGEPVTVALAFKADPRFQPALLHVETTPPGASISVDGSIVGVTPWEGEVPRGEHDVELTLAGHVTEQRRVNALGREPYQLKVKLKPVPVVKEQPVVLSVTSQPAGAALQLDGKGVGKTPWSSKVMPGSHEVKLTLAGYELYTDLVAAPGVVQASLTPLPSGVRVSLPSTPGDLQVLIDGQPVAAEGGVYASPPGRHLVELRASGFLPAKTTSAVGPGQVTVVSMKLVPAPVAAKQGLRVTSEPSGAQVSLNDAKVGVTPWEDTALTPGPYRVTVSRPGFEPASVSLEVKKKQVTEHAVALTPSPVPVAIESTPAGARVFVDGDDKGLTPLMVRLPPGKHRAYLVLEGHQTVDELKDVEVAATPRWAWALVSTAAPLPPPPPPPKLEVAPPPPPPVVAAGSSLDALRALLADESIDAQVKRSELESYARTHEDLTEPIGVVAPAKLKDELCVKWAERVRNVRYQSRAVDSFGNAQLAELFVNGVRYAGIPFDGSLPWCARTIEAREGDRALLRPAEKPLDAKVLNTDEWVFPGRQRRVSFSAFGELALAPLLNAQALALSGADLNAQNFAFGLRFDFWGQLFHLSVAVKEAQLFRESLYGDPQLLWAPLGDLFVGLTAAAGTEQVRYRFTVDVGAWSLVCPGLRLGHTVSIGERLFLTLTMDGAWIPSPLLPRLYAGTSLASTWLIGGTFAAGVGF